jgi:hypothetical protein
MAMGKESVRPLRDVFADLAGQAPGPADAGSAAADPRSLLAEHDGLPDELLVTAIGSYAGTAPAEVAEHLAPAAGADAQSALSLLASAPVGTWDAEVDLPGLDGATAEDASGLDLDGLDSADNLDQDDDAPLGGDLVDHDDAQGGEVGSDRGFDQDAADADPGGPDTNGQHTGDTGDLHTGDTGDQVTDLDQDDPGFNQGVPDLHQDIPELGPDQHFDDRVEHQDTAQLPGLDELAGLDDGHGADDFDDFDG